MVNRQTFALAPQESLSPGVDIDGEFAFQLPGVKCDRCKRRVGFPHIEYPLLQATAEMVRRHKDVSVEEFAFVREIASKALGGTTLVVPGASAGPFAGWTHRRLRDFAWVVSWTLLASKELKRLLSDAGITLSGADAQIRMGRRLLDTHQIIQCEPASLLDEEDLPRLGIAHCAVCGDYWRPSTTPYPREGYRFRRDKWPVGKHLVKPLEYPAMIVLSPECYDFLRSRTLSGAVLRSVGIWV